MLFTLIACSATPTVGDDADADKDAITWRTVDYECGDATAFTWPDAVPLVLSHLTLRSDESVTIWEATGIQWRPGREWTTADGDTECDATNDPPVIGGRIVYSFEE